MTWRAISRSVIGTSHQQQQIPCQDYSSDRILNEVIVGAVADGAGSAKYADLGAKIAVTSAIECLASTEAWLRDQRHLSWQQLAKAPSTEQARKLFAKTLSHVLLALQQQAQNHRVAVPELACTLLAFLATPRWIAAMQIGDGFIVVRSSPSKDYRLLFQPDKGEYANQTTFVTSETALADMQVRVSTDAPQFICAATDGIERVAIRMQDWTPFAPFFQPLEEYLHETPNPQGDDAYLMHFLESERLNQRTDDDKTLLLCLHQG